MADEDLRERLLEQFRSMRNDMVPTALRLFDDDDLKMSHSAALVVLARGSPPTVNELASQIGRSVSRTSRLVEQLVGRGLVERLADGGDRRIRRVRLTVQGADLLERVQRVRIKAMEDLVDHLSEAERKQVVEAMDLLVRAARRSVNGQQPGDDRTASRDAPGGGGPGRGAPGRRQSGEPR